MKETITETPMFGLFLIISTYALGNVLHKKWPIPLFAPLVFSIFSIIFLLMMFDVEYTTFQLGGDIVHMLITPATVSLAIILEKNYRYLKEYYPSILLGIGIGTIVHTLIVLGFVALFSLDQQIFASFFSKSITTAIALSVSDSLGGIEALTVTLVVITGILGSLIGPFLFKVARIHDPIAQGAALGSGAHAMGTSKAIQLGDVHGAVSGISIILTGISFVLLTSIASLIIQ